MDITKINNLFNSSTNSNLETQELGIQFSKFIKNGDVIVELAGRRITHAYHYTYAVDSLKIGKEARIVVNRGGKQISFRILPIAKK